MVDGHNRFPELLSLHILFFILKYNRYKLVKNFDIILYSPRGCYNFSLYKIIEKLYFIKMIVTFFNIKHFYSQNKRGIMPVR